MNRKSFLKNIISFIVKHWKKWTILAILAMLIYIAAVFYYYIYQPIYRVQETDYQKLEIKEEVYREVMDNYLERGQNISKIINRTYPNPFRQ